MPKWNADVNEAVAGTSEVRVVLEERYQGVQ